jgi:threonylcarbamoyladenosine tRNA methylthiotransferase MtaB
MHIFKYSRREGTKAAVMPNQVPEEVKNRRSASLLELEAKMSKEFRDEYIGKEVTVLMEEPYSCDGKNYYIGYTKEYVKVAYETAKNLSNQFVTGCIARRLTDDIYLFASN